MLEAVDASARDDHASDWFSESRGDDEVGRVDRAECHLPVIELVRMHIESSEMEFVDRDDGRAVIAEEGGEQDEG